MSTFSILVCLLILLHICFATSTRPMMQISEAIAWRSMKNSTGESATGSCRTGNPMDDCWRCDPEWKANRRILADCAIGFGRNSVGGRDGEYYVVTDADNDDPVNPVKGTLRYGAMQDEPLWIIFDRDMSIVLKEELLIKSYKTIDGRGSNVEIGHGPCITIENASNIIIHGIYIHHCVPAAKAMSLKEADYELGNSDGDGISIFRSRDLWIDHCTLSTCHDGLIDATFGSTAITISNNYMFNHNEVMLMGHSDDFLDDRNMQVTIAFNYFGAGLVQRMPRCRHGYFHVVNNIYTGWKMYAIGGSASPTINSQGNVFSATDDDTIKEVTKRETPPGDEGWKDWNWRSEGDLMLNGAYFRSSGKADARIYAKASSMVARPASLLNNLAQFAGVLDCKIGQMCT